VNVTNLPEFTAYMLMQATQFEAAYLVRKRLCRFVEKRPNH